MRTIRWGILGGGKIAHKFANDLALVEDAQLAAIACRDESRGKAFAEKFSIPFIFHSYEEMVASDKLDVVYIATPHGFHHEHTLLCLTYGKAVLCEKAFALNTRQAKEMIATAKAKKIFLMEAFWTKFLPQFQKVNEIISSGTIGDIRWVQADFGFKAPEPPAQRLYDPALGGGALLDIGIYPVFLALTLLGKPDGIQAAIVPYDTGVDEQCSVAFTYSNRVIATLSGSFAADTPVEAVIAGTKGRIQWRNRFHNAISEIELVDENDGITTIDVYREKGYGYQFEARHVNECLRKGLTESSVMTHQDTIALMETLDRIRAVAGIRYAVD